jgi:glucosamine 6-phosphate synthetase-like amidotransferase/phosphosugar isomerase protein
MQRSKYPSFIAVHTLNQMSLVVIAMFLPLFLSQQGLGQAAIGTLLALSPLIALKYDEMSHIPAKGMCPGRHLHGALGTTTYNILTIVLAPGEDPNYSALRDVSQVTRMLKAPSIGIISGEDKVVAEEVDDVFRIPETEPILFSILAVLPGQLLPYFAGVAQGNVNPDCQRADVARHARVWHWLFPKGTH